MKARTLIFGGLMLVGVVYSCEQKSVEEEVDDVCECIKAAENDKEFDICFEKMEQISDKYAFDPEAAEDVKKRLRECATN